MGILHVTSGAVLLVQPFHFFLPFTLESAQAFSFFFIIIFKFYIFHYFILFYFSYFGSLSEEFPQFGLILVPAQAFVPGGEEGSSAGAVSRSSTPVQGGVQPLLAVVPTPVFQVFLGPAAWSAEFPYLSLLWGNFLISLMV